MKPSAWALRRPVSVVGRIEAHSAITSVIWDNLRRFCKPAKLTSVFVSCFSLQGKIS